VWYCNVLHKQNRSNIGILEGVRSSVHVVIFFTCLVYFDGPIKSLHWSFRVSFECIKKLFYFVVDLQKIFYQNVESVACYLLLCDLYCLVLLAESDGFWATVCEKVRPMLSDCCPVCDIGALWPNSWMDQDETWRASRPRTWPHCVRRGPSSPSPKGAEPLNCWPISVVAKWLHGSRCHFVWR